MSLCLFFCYLTRVTLNMLYQKLDRLPQGRPGFERRRLRLGLQRGNHASKDTNNLKLYTGCTETAEIMLNN